MALDSPAQAQAPRPAWFQEIWADYQAGMANTFILHGHSHDYVDHPEVNLTVREYLEELLGTRYALATFAPDEGIGFPGGDLIGQETRDWLDLVTGRTPAPAAASGGFDPIAALRAAGGPGGFSGGSDENPLPTDAPTAIALLIEFLKLANEKAEGVPSSVNRAGKLTGKRSAVLVERLDLIAPPAEKAQINPGERALLALLHRSGTLRAINTQRNLLILLAPSLEEVHPDLRLAASGIRAIEIPPPNHEQRLMFVTRAIGQQVNAQGELTRPAVQLDGITETELANQTAGLNRRHIEDLVLRAAVGGGVVTQAMVRARKAEQIGAEYAGVLEILEPDVSFEDVGGHDLIKAWLKDRVIRPMRDPSRRHKTPMGLLFAGPSGTGKTFLARALSKETEYNCVALKPDNLRGMWVGESEKKTRKAIEGVLAMAPCILFIDEIDTKLRRSGGEGGSGVEGNIFGSMLEFLSDTSHRGQVLLVAATNRPDNIDAALRRPGRIDFSLPLLPPETPEERADAVRALVARLGLPTVSPEALLAIGQQTDGWTPAELEGLTVAADNFIDLDDLPVEQAFTEALEEMRPATADVRWHTDLAIEACNNAKLVPAKYRARVGKSLPKRETAAAATAVDGRVGRVGAGANDEFELG